MLLVLLVQPAHKALKVMRALQVRTARWLVQPELMVPLALKGR